MSKLPILVLAYRRLDSLKQVFAALNKQERGAIYVSSDAAKSKDEVEVKAVREYLNLMLTEGLIDHLNLRQENSGIANAVMEGIDWFMQNEDCGVVIEDDIVLQDGVLISATNILSSLLNNPLLFSINLRNEVPVRELNSPENLARLSRLVSSHGWITSREKWNAFRLNYNNLNAKHLKIGIPDDFGFFAKKAFIEYFKRNRRNSLDLSHSWDVEWQTYVFSKKGYTINLNQNAVSYIGYDNLSTHHKAQPRMKDIEVPTQEIAKNEIIGEWDTRADKYRFRIAMRHTFPRYLVRVLRLDSILKNRWNW